MFQTKLQMRLESGEPKCANCAKWEPDPSEHFGVCKRMQETMAIHLPADAPARALTMAAIRAASVTTDLTVCSMWEMKDGQAKAEEVD